VEAELRQITAVFCDLVGSTEISARLDPEEFGDLVSRYHDETVEVLRRYEAEVARFIGDGVLIHFGWPEAHDDDAERAVRAALDIAAAVKVLDAEFPADVTVAVRIGLHTGQALIGNVGAGPGREMALGKTLNVAARLQEIAPPGTVLMSDATQRLVSGLFVTEDLGAKSLKGIPEPLHTYRVVQPSGVRSRLDAARKSLTPMVDRKPELSRLTELWEGAHGGKGQTVVISGEPGVGKSRLVLEFQERARQDSHSWFECHCSSYTRHTAFRPVLELVEQGLGLRGGEGPTERLARLRRGLEVLRIDEDDAVPVLARALSIPPEAGFTPPTISPAQQRRRMLELFTEWALRLTQLQPTVVLVEDLHWADPSSLELFERLIERSTRTSLMMVGTARSEFESQWPTQPGLSKLELAPLDESYVRQLIGGLRPGQQLPVSLVEHVIRETAGIPLFAEEMTKSLLESGLLAAGEGSFEAGSLPLDIPASLSDSLMARLDRLSAAKRVAQHAAIIGREFDEALAEEVVDMSPDLVRHGLARLVQEDVLISSGGPPNPTYVFKHALIQDAAYGSLLKRTRRQLHERAAKALERRRAGGDQEPSPEVVGRHYEAAGCFEEAVALYREAAEQAVRQSAHREALAHLTRAIRLIGELPDEESWHAVEADLQAALASSVIATRGYADAEVERAYERARALYELLGDQRQVGFSLAGLSLYYFNCGEVERGAALASQALELAVDAGDETLGVLARVQVAVPTFYQGRFAAALEHAEAAAAAHDRERHRWLGYRFGADQGVAAHCFAALSLMRLGYPDRALARARDAVELGHQLSDPYNLAYALFFETAVHWNRGDADTQVLTAAQVLAVAEEQEFKLLIGLGRMMRAAGRAVMTGDQSYLEEVYAGSGIAAGTGFRGGLPAFVCLVAEAQQAVGLFEAALGTVTVALSAAEETGQHYWDSELHRLRGELAGDDSELRRAIEIARAQNAAWPELRAAVALARRLGAPGRELLAPIYERFEEGFSTRELREAAELLGVEVPVP
jgi:class 3 adenylate cyclase/predicted ATPase